MWEDSLSSGMEVYGIVNNEVPLVQFRMNIRGGLLLENAEKIGVSNLLAELMTKGTKNRTTEELENAIESLGAEISVNAGNENITITGNTLAKNYDETIALVKEILLEPRWDSKEFELAKKRLDRMLKDYHSEEVDYFIKAYIPSFSLSLDEISKEEAIKLILDNSFDKIISVIEETRISRHTSP